MIAAAVALVAVLVTPPPLSPSPAPPSSTAPSPPAGATSPEAGSPVSPGTATPLAAGDRSQDAVIVNSGSTNTAGYTISLAPDGSALVRLGSAVENRTVARPQTNWLFSRLAAAGPLDGLSTTHCMKSVSFGTSTTIAWHGATSGDLSCRPSPAGEEIARTIGVIVGQLGIDVRPQRRFPMRAP